MGGKRSAERAHIHMALEGIPGYQNASPTDYVKRPRRSVAAEANRVENAEWQCLAVAQIKAPSRCMDWCDRYGQGLRNGGLEIVGPVGRGMSRLRHQLVANTTMESRGFGTSGRLRLPTALGSSTYSGVLKEVTGPVSLPGAQESWRADVCNAQEPLHRGEAMRISQHARKSIGNKVPEQMRRGILRKRRRRFPSSGSPFFLQAESRPPS
jgi:hypothetical protein